MSACDDIEFELPQEDAAKELCRLLGPSSHVGMTDDGWAVQAVLDPDPGAVASLLRSVEAWVAERGLHAIRFYLDGRWYVLQAGEATWSLEAA